MVGTYGDRKAWGWAFRGGKWEHGRGGRAAGGWLYTRGRPYNEYYDQPSF